MPGMIRFCSAASFAVILLAGCGGSPPSGSGPEESNASGPASSKTLTIHVPEMGDRLKLM